MQRLILFLIIFLYTTLSNGQEYKELSAVQCDSLINANYNNPNFVILDVRTPGEYIPQHLVGAINRNYYQDFDSELDLLDKNKTYLIHCKSGSRSAGAFNKMQAKNFAKVYNMRGGINAWNSNSFATTSDFAPRIMFVSDSVFEFNLITIGDVDTIEVVLTNRANDTLRFDSISSLLQYEAFTDFDLDTILLGGKDYSFNIYYEPMDEEFDSIMFYIYSNAGIVNVKAFRSGLNIAPIIELVSDTIVQFGDVEKGKTDTIQITIGNKGITDLRFTGIDYNSTQFQLDFDIDAVVNDGDTYSFNAYFTPTEIGEDSVSVFIESTGGNVQIVLKGKGIYPVNTHENELLSPGIYPNPANDFVIIDGLKSIVAHLELFNLNGKILLKQEVSNNSNINLTKLNSGNYYLKIIDGNNVILKKLLIH